MMSHIERLFKDDSRILLDSFALRLVHRINTYLDSNPHNWYKEMVGVRIQVTVCIDSMYKM